MMVRKIKYGFGQIIILQSTLSRVCNTLSHLPPLNKACEFQSTNNIHVNYGKIYSITFALKYGILKYLLSMLVKFNQNFGDMLIHGPICQIKENAMYIF